ncbi:MAG: YciI family protein, partial [Amphritea sp.]
YTVTQLHSYTVTQLHSYTVTQQIRIFMRLVVIFKDKPEMMAHRDENESLHFAYLEKHYDEIIVGGGLRHEPGGCFVGSLWVLEVESFERANELVINDPYFVPELREYEILVWGKAGSRDVIL